MYNHEVNGLNVKADIIVDGEQLAEIRKNVLSKYKNEKVDGFRKGHAPEDVIEKTYKKHIDQDILSEVINTEVEKLIEENNFKILAGLDVKDYSITNEQVKVSVSFELKPEVKLSQYKGLNINVDVKEVTKEDIDKTVENILNSNKTLEQIIDRTDAKDGDIANINFEGFVDGVAFDGGKAENHDLKLGSKSFIDTFEEQIVGKNVGDEFDVNVKFPDEYHAENLKGKQAVFKVKLNELKQEKEATLTDEIAKKYGFETVDSLLADIKTGLEEKNAKDAENEKFQKIADYIVENTEVELSEKLVEEQKNAQIENFKNQIAQNGFDLEKYFEISGQTSEEFEKINLENAKKTIKYNFAIQEIALVENVKITKEDLDLELAKVASMYGLTPEQLIEEAKKYNMVDNYIRQIEGQVFLNKIKEFLVQNN